MPGRKISNAPKTNNFAASFVPLKLKREFKEDYMEGGESKAGVGLRDS